MFKKVIIAEEQGIISQGVIMVLDSLGIKDVHQVQYCDDAYLKIKTAVMQNTPFELLITALSFKNDYRDQRYSSGEELIKVLAIEHPNLNIIVYSNENRSLKIESMIATCIVDSFVCKGRKDLTELPEAIKAVANNKTYVSPQFQKVLKNGSNQELDDYDIILLKQLAKGKSQKAISVYFKKKRISPSSLSIIEKKLNKLKIHFSANNAIHLISITKEAGLI